MKLLIFLTVLTVALAAYVTVIRPWMRTTTLGAKFLDKIEPLERVLWWKSETILWSRFKLLMGALLTVLVQVAGTDWSAVAPLIPEKYRHIVMSIPTIILALDGLIGERLRRDTTKPLEIVGMRTDAAPEVKEAAAEAAAANAKAVEKAIEKEAV